MGCNSCNKNQKCDKCAPKARYCGDALTCINVQKGESYDSIIKKVNDLLCSQVEPTTYIFEENLDCESTGFIVSEVQGEVTQVVFAYCQECCGGDEGLALQSQLNNPLIFSESNDIGDSPFILPFNTNSVIPDLETTITIAGDYLLNFDFVVYSTYDLSVNFQVLKNGVAVPNTVKSVIIDGATPPTSTNTYVLNTLLSGLLVGDEINIQFRSVLTSGGTPSPENINITSATLILNKI